MKSFKVHQVVFSLILVGLVSPITTGAVVYTSGPGDAISILNVLRNVRFHYIRSTAGILEGRREYLGGVNYSWVVPVLQFPLHHFNGMADVSATLGLYCTRNTGSGKASLRYVDMPGNGNIQSSLAGTGADIANGRIYGTGWMTFDVSCEVQTAIDKGYEWAVFNVHLPSDMEVHFISSENTDARYADVHPQLSVIPEPATLAMLLAGGALLYRRRRMGYRAQDTT